MSDWSMTRTRLRTQANGWAAMARISRRQSVALARIHIDGGTASNWMSFVHAHRGERLARHPLGCEISIAVDDPQENTSRAIDAVFILESLVAEIGRECRFLGLQKVEKADLPRRDQCIAQGALRAARRGELTVSLVPDIAQLASLSCPVPVAGT